MPRLPRPIYATLRLAEMLIQSVSRFANAAFLGGSTYQTISARAYITDTPAWTRARRVIDAVFFFQPDHCQKAWLAEIHHAHMALAHASPNPI